MVDCVNCIIGMKYMPDKNSFYCESCGAEVRIFVKIPDLPIKAKIVICDEV